MLRLVLFALLVIAPAAHAARPKYIHQSQTIKMPAGYFYFGNVVAIDGDWAIVDAATRPTREGETQHNDALLYRRVNGTWTFDRRLLRLSQLDGPEPNDNNFFTTIVMSNGFAALASYKKVIYVFKRTNDTWAQIAHPFTAPAGAPDHVSGELVWHGNTLLAEKDCVYGQHSWGARIATVSADGTSWSPIQRVSGSGLNCTLEPFSWAISGDTVLVGLGSDDPETTSSETRVYRRSGTQWSQTATGDAATVGVQGNEMFFGVGGAGGTRVYRNDDTFTLIDRLRSVGAGYVGPEEGYSLEFAQDVVLTGRDVYRKNVEGKYEHVARLVNRGISSLVGSPKVSGRTAISSAGVGGSNSTPAVMFHELPTTYTPSPVIATGFNGAAPFTPVSGSFAIATTSNGNRVYRQSATNTEYRALLNYSDWQEHAFSADIRATGGSAGIAARHQDNANYYAAFINSDNTVTFHARRNGELTALITRPLPNAMGRVHNLAIRILNYNLTVYVDGRETMTYGDLNPIPRGSAALIGMNSVVDYDNVVAAQVGQTFIYDLEYNGWCHGNLSGTISYIRTGTGTWSCGDVVNNNGEFVSTFSQTSTVDIARAVIGMTPTDDQVASARLRFTAVNGQDRFIGLVTRYVDANNYYYLALRTNNTVSLRKLVNGTPIVLTTASLPVSVGSWYDVRLDAVGNELRAVVNGVQVLQTTDTSHSKGRNGMLTYKAAAEWTDYLTWQP